MLGFRGSAGDNFARNVMKMEIASSDMQLRETDLEQSRKDHGSRIAAHLAMLIGVLLLLFLLVRPLFVSSTAKEKKDFFYQYTAQKMNDYKPGYFLYEELTDPVALMQTGVWSAYAGEMDDPEAAVADWLGEGYAVQSWDDLVEAESARLWEEWYYGTEDITSDDFILREIDRCRAGKSLPGLGDSTWLVTDPAGVRYILVRPGEKGWYIQPLAEFQ